MSPFVLAASALSLNLLKTALSKVKERELANNNTHIVLTLTVFVNSHERFTYTALLAVSASVMRVQSLGRQI